MGVLKMIRSHAVEMVIILLLVTLGLVGYNTYKIQQLSGDIEDLRYGTDYASRRVDDLLERPSSPNSDALDSIQKTLDAMESKLDSMDNDIFDIRHGLR